MKYIMIRADDLGYSEGINYGIAKSVKEGIINNVGLMANMEASEHGFMLIKDETICLGMHANISAGRSIAPPDQIPSITKITGQFKDSKEYRDSKKDFVVLDEAIMEIEAQYKRFIEITGRVPCYIDVHAVNSENFIKAAEMVATDHNTIFSSLSFDGTPVNIGKRQMYIWLESSKADYNPEEAFIYMVENAHENALDVMVYHPGYLDDAILSASSLTIPRTKEVTAACGKRLKEYIKEKQIHLYTYTEFFYM